MRFYFVITTLLVLASAVNAAEPCDFTWWCGSAPSGNYGCLLYTLDGVDAYSNGGWTGNGSGCGKYQCVSFVNRYYEKVYDIDLSGLSGNTCAKYAFDDWVQKNGLFQFVNGEATTQPQRGDILCFTGTCGHVAIISEVGAAYVKYVDQNRTADASKMPAQADLSVANGRYTIKNTGSLTVQGWLRNPSGDPPPPPPTFLTAPVSKALSPSGPYAPGQRVTCEMRFRNEGTGTWTKEQ